MKNNLKKELQIRAGQVATRAELIMAKTRDWQAVLDSISNQVAEPLTEDQEKKKERYQFMYNQLVSGKFLDNEVVNQTMKMFDIQISQAYEDLKATREIFNTVISLDKQFELNLALQECKRNMRKCSEIGDMNNLHKFEKNKIAIISALEDLQDDRGELFEGHTFEFTFDPSLLGGPAITKKDMIELMASINAKREKKINIDLFEELEFKNVEDGSS